MPVATGLNKQGWMGIYVFYLLQNPIRLCQRPVSCCAVRDPWLCDMCQLRKEGATSATTGFPAGVNLEA